MKKRITFFLILFGFSIIVRADHITGGEMFYVFSGYSDGLYHYNVTLKLFMRCNSGRQFNDPTIVSVFDRTTNNRVSDISVPLASRETISLTNSHPCITNPPIVCYEVGYFHFNMSLPGNAGGYVIASQVNYRIAGITNLSPNYGLIGALYSAEIPGTSSITAAPQNHSAKFIGSDLVIVCADNSFEYSFAAQDNDGDRLRYYFCDAFQSGSGGNNNPPPAPPFQPVPYSPNFSGSSPLGNNVQINSNTGLITGVAPASGIYVVTVCVEEIRNGVVIAVQRKDLQINIAPCTIAGASLFPEYMLCRNTKTISISNLSTSPLINSYFWEFKDNAGLVIFTSTNSSVTYTFPDTGSYKIKLVINRGEQCSDSTTSIARVYPGFVPDFNFHGICFTKPTIFTDVTTTVYGTVNSWYWDFGESTSAADVSTQPNSTYTYPTMGFKNPRLIVGNSVGCRDTLVKNISIVDKPPITLAFRDTLICLNDSVKLRASGSGNFKWSPNVSIVNATTSTPTVSPSTTITYFVDLDDNGCQNKDSVRVRLVDHVSLQVMNDTTICQGDSIRLRIISDGFTYSWVPASQCIDPTSANPIAVTNSTTNYEVTAFIGGCSTREQIQVSTVPYPVAIAGPDTTICYGTVAQLSGRMDGTSSKWSPAASLNYPNILNPIASPTITTAYILSAFDTRGCPKPGRDTILVTMLPEIRAFAGQDTSVVIGQPLQLNATGGVSYSWSPPTGLSATNISNPLAIYNSVEARLKYKVLVYNEAGCVDSAFISVKVFKTLPSVFVPTAFTPNGDRKNDIFRPIAVGIQRIEYFNVYNRWGQLIFTTSFGGTGWDGTIAGKLQATGTYAWMIKAIDYRGIAHFQKGTVVLIR